MEATAEKTLTPKGFAKAVGISVQTVYAWIGKGWIVAANHGRGTKKYYSIRPDQVDAARQRIAEAQG